MKIEHPLYKLYKGMKNRCNLPNQPSYKYYGGRGIKVCDRWAVSFEDFVADMGERPSLEHSIDRINNNGNYEPSNCRWATKQEQQLNKNVAPSNRPNKPIAETPSPSKQRIGEKHGRSVLTEKQVLDIRSLNDLNFSQIARQYNVSSTLISKIIKRKVWTHI